ncbi:MAG TPA: hypothetical protein VLB76_12195 [Thermoanaerobaculia bacterium]|jgi:hypothetical protein|nr:hypothetical protein [Thermoanaerobaculia bacterium]
MARPLTAEDLLAGAAAAHTVDVPAALLGVAGDGDGGAAAGQIVLRPLTVRDVQRVTRAAKEQRLLTSILMVQQSLVTPKLSVEQVGGLPAGLVQFLLARVNEISGLTLDDGDLDRAVRAPIARACFVLAREFGWTAAECSELTLGQVLLYLEMLARDGDGGAEGGEG